MRKNVKIIFPKNSINTGLFDFDGRKCISFLTSKIIEIRKKHSFLQNNLQFNFFVIKM